MKKIAYLFPGQGSQYVGMGAEIEENYPAAKAVYEQANTALGYDIRQLCITGPEERLNQTVYTQPAILTTSLAILAVLQEQGVKAQWAAGHSLGEYTALVATGVLPVAEAVKLVSLRAQLMEQAVPPGIGAMAAIVGLERERVIEICGRFQVPDVAEAVNFNCPGQIVISGTKTAVQQAMDLCKAAGAKLCKMLPVSVPSHCSLMKTAADKLARELDKINLNAPQIPLVANVSARTVGHEELKTALVRQLHSPVLWEDSMQYLITQGVELFIEVGPGQVLSKLLKRIDSQAQVLNIEDVSSMNRVLAAISN